MTLEAFDWSVAVIAYWNRAILTPAGIARRLFGLAQDTPVVVEVSMDGLAPFRVRHEGLTVSAEIGRLVIHVDEPKYEGLDRAKALAAKAVDGLPETPLTAAGFNVRARIDDPPKELLAAIECGVDALLSDAQFTIKSRALRRTLPWGEGDLNLNIQEEDDFRVELNFHRQSAKRHELVGWLNSPISEVAETVSKVFKEIVGISVDGMGT